MRKLQNNGYHIEKIKRNDRAKGEFKCHFCKILDQRNIGFATKDGLLRHNAIHLGLKKVKCPHCAHTARSDNLNQHIVTKHPSAQVETPTEATIIIID